MSNNKPVPKFQAVLRISKRSNPEVISRSRIYVTEMTGNAYFPNPSPSLSSISTQIQLLEDAFSKSQTGLKGSVAQLIPIRRQLLLMLKALAAYVEAVANEESDLAGPIIQSAGMDVKRAPPKPNRAFTAEALPMSGQIRLSTQAIPRSVFIYQVSTQPNNPASWETVHIDLRVKKTLTGLTPGIRYYFRMATVTNKIQSDWSPMVAVIAR
jgi:hypothetical protein